METDINAANFILRVSPETNGALSFRSWSFVKDQCGVDASFLSEGHIADKITFDDLAHLPAIVGGIEQDFTYGDCKEEMDMINKAFIETMIEGDAEGRGFQYPIPTYSITSDFDWSDTENNRLLFEMQQNTEHLTSLTTSTVTWSQAM